VLKPLSPIDDPVVTPLLIPVLPVLVELPTLLEAAAPAAVSPPALSAPCAKAIEGVIARTEAKAIVVSFMCCSFHRETSKATAPAMGRGELGPSSRGRAVGGTGTPLMWVAIRPLPLNFL
jgi:hypothetical protein